MTNSKVSFGDLSKEEQQYFEEVIANGCGPKNLPWLTHFLQNYFYGNLLYANCVQHDFNFVRGGGLKDFLKANWDMCSRMLIDSVIKIWKGLFFAFVALCYLMGITLGGAFFFNFGPYKTKDEILTAN